MGFRALSKIQLRVAFLSSFGVDDNALEQIIARATERTGISPIRCIEQNRALDHDRNVLQRMRIALISSDVIVFICHAPSIGLGYELTYVTNFHKEKPVLIFVRKSAEEEDAVTRETFFHVYSIRGYQVIRYDSLAELQKSLISSLALISRLLASRLSKREYRSLRVEEASLISTLKKTMKTNILILGKDSDSEGMAKMDRIARCLEKQGYTPVSLKNLPEIYHLSLEGKMIRVGALSRFVLVEDSRPSGHIDEINICARCEYVTASVREAGSGSTWMQAHYPVVYRFMNRFCYSDDPKRQDSSCDKVYSTLEESVRAAAEWAEHCIDDLEKEYRRKLYSNF